MPPNFNKVPRMISSAIVIGSTRGSCDSFPSTAILYLQNAVVPLPTSRIVSKTVLLFVQISLKIFARYRQHPAWERFREPYTPALRELFGLRELIRS